MSRTPVGARDGRSDAPSDEPSDPASGGVLAGLVAGARAVLLDFDGPVCGVFAGHPAAGAAARLRQVLDRRGLPAPAGLRAERDPLAVLHHAAGVGPLPSGLMAELDATLARYERAAVDTATPTPHATRVLATAAAAGLGVGVVSNNSAGAIRAYLAAHRLTDQVAVVVGRPAGNPAGMKPHPGPVLLAAARLGLPPQACLLVGDSVSDVVAGRAAGVACVGFANRPGKQVTLDGADTVITCMGELADAITECDRRGAWSTPAGCRIRRPALHGTRHPARTPSIP